MIHEPKNKVARQGLQVCRKKKKEQAEEAKGFESKLIKDNDFSGFGRARLRRLEKSEELVGKRQDLGFGDGSQNAARYATNPSEMRELEGLSGIIILLVRIILDICGGLFGFGTLSPTNYNYY